MKKQLPDEIMRAKSKARRRRCIKVLKAQGKWIVRKKFKIVSVSSDEGDFSACTSTRDVVDSLAAYIDRLIKWNNVPRVTFTDEHGKKKTASFSSLSGIEVDDAWDFEGTPDDF